MPVKPIAVAVASALVVVSSTMLASPEQTTQQPGQMTQAHVWIDNRGRNQAIPVELATSITPLRVQVVNGERHGSQPMRSGRYGRSWEYQTVTVPPARTWPAAERAGRLRLGDDRHRGREGRGHEAAPQAAAAARKGGRTIRTARSGDESRMWPMIFDGDEASTTLNDEDVDGVVNVDAAVSADRAARRSPPPARRWRYR